MDDDANGVALSLQKTIADQSRRVMDIGGERRGRPGQKALNAGAFVQLLSGPGRSREEGSGSERQMFRTRSLKSSCCKQVATRLATLGVVYEVDYKYI